MKKSCSFCGNKNFREDKVQYIYKHDNRFLVVNNVPAEVCEFCGEQYFKADVLKKIEKEFSEIHSAGKKAKNVLRMPVEEFVEI
ncbi:MAG: type II toxin-antitoxin system MqsA family antitoxin [Nitrospirae bacterium]|nr:type II toxin-antitoxin system MqsA family antitoxin [Nitrospirota bacterium]